ncbi:MAG: segregation/condensation protein A [Verrucomicrobiales bacterium]|nr:segregation/condensation protein A [Verrucomicrobiales bacterium]
MPPKIGRFLLAWGVKVSYLGAVEDDYRVRLDIFEGPLDLLLYLIKRDEVDIYDISIERITKQYLKYMDTFKMLNIDLASEFIVMAANLMYIKSRTLLPKQVQTPEDEEDEDDPRWELIRQLIEYKKFKDAAGFLNRKALEASQVYASVPDLPEEPEEEEEPEPMPNVGIFDLIRAFQKVLNRFEEESALEEIEDDQFTVSDKIDYLLNQVSAGGTIKFSALFAGVSNREEVIVTFIALLELIKLRQFSVEQKNLLGDILLLRNENT